MVKLFKMIKVDENTHKELIKARAMYELKEGMRLTMSQIIKMLIDDRPKIRIIEQND